MAVQIVCAVGDETIMLWKKHNFQQPSQLRNWISVLIFLKIWWSSCLWLVHLDQLISIQIQTLMVHINTPEQIGANVDIASLPSCSECTYLFHNRWIVLPMEKWSHATRSIISKTSGLLCTGTGIGAGVTSTWWVYRGSWAPRNGTLLCGPTPNGWEKNSRVFLVLSTMAAWKALHGPSLEVSAVEKKLNQQQCGKTVYHIAQAAVNATVTFRPDVIVFEEE